MTNLFMSDKRCQNTVMISDHLYHGHHHHHVHHEHHHHNATLIQALCQRPQHYREGESSSSANSETYLEAADQHCHNNDDQDDDTDDQPIVNLSMMMMIILPPDLTWVSLRKLAPLSRLAWVLMIVLVEQMVVTQMITMVTQMIMKICWSLYLVRAPCFHPEVLFAVLVFKMVGDGKLPPRIIALNRSKIIFSHGVLHEGFYHFTFNWAKHLGGCK